MRTVYLDNNATTNVAPEVFEQMRPFFCEEYGNPSSIHTFGGKIGKLLDKSRKQVAQLIGAEASEIVFTSCGTESDSTAIRGTLESYPGKRHIITTRVEHPAVRGLCQYLSQQGYRVTELSVNREGLLDLDELREALDPDTALVSIMWANNETGVLFPIEQIAEIVKASGAVLHTDAVQAAGKETIDVSKVPVDLLSISGHKLHAPKGIGVLYIRRGTRLAPLLVGGHQEHGRRAGTENVPYIIGLGKACELASESFKDELVRVRKLRDRLEEALLDNCPGAKLNGHKKNRLVNTTSISFEYVEGEAILLLLDRLGICASSGSACTSGSLEPSHVLRAMGVPFTSAHGSIRFSLSRYNTEQDIEYVIEHMPGIIEKLRDISPFGRDKTKPD
ncbi:MAG: cysteine desulfurase NifS [Actinobacteria bacterium]|nr:cysteine desulfurase NifS [Actinomycetota bacterium]